MIVKLLDFQVDGEVYLGKAKAIASVQIGDKGYYVHGIYAIDENEFQPNILGDPYEIEDYYEQIKTLVKER